MINSNYSNITKTATIAVVSACAGACIGLYCFSSTEEQLAKQIGNYISQPFNDIANQNHTSYLPQFCSDVVDQKHTSYLPQFCNDVASNMSLGLETLIQPTFYYPQSSAPKDPLKESFAQNNSTLAKVSHSTSYALPIAGIIVGGAIIAGAPIIGATVAVGKAACLDAIAPLAFHIITNCPFI